MKRSLVHPPGKLLRQPATNNGGGAAAGSLRRYLSSSRALNLNA